VLDKEATITISPITGGECILNVPQTIAAGANLVIPSNVKLTVSGNLTVLQH